MSLARPRKWFHMKKNFLYLIEKVLGHYCARLMILHRFLKKSTIVMVTHVTKDHSRGNRLWPHFIVVVVQKATCVLQTLERTRQHPTSNQQVRQVSTFLYLQLINAQKRWIYFFFASFKNMHSFRFRPHL